MSNMRLDIFKWSTKQSKQVTAGYPLLTVLTCLEADKQMLTNLDPLVELMQRQIKDRKNAVLAVLCISRCVLAYVLRFSQRAEQGQVERWVSRALGLTFQAFGKGILGGVEVQVRWLQMPGPREWGLNRRRRGTQGRSSYNRLPCRSSSVWCVSTSQSGFPCLD